MIGKRNKENIHNITTNTSGIHILKTYPTGRYVKIYKKKDKDHVRIYEKKGEEHICDINASCFNNQRKADLHFNLDKKKAHVNIFGQETDDSPTLVVEYTSKKHEYLCRQQKDGCMCNCKVRNIFISCIGNNEFLNIIRGDFHDVCFGDIAAFTFNIIKSRNYGKMIKYICDRPVPCGIDFDYSIIINLLCRHKLSYKYLNQSQLVYAFYEHCHAVTISIKKNDSTIIDSFRCMTAIIPLLDYDTMKMLILSQKEYSKIHELLHFFNKYVIKQNNNKRYGCPKSVYLHYGSGSAILLGIIAELSHKITNTYQYTCRHSNTKTSFFKKLETLYNLCRPTKPCVYKFFKSSTNKI